MHRKAILHNDIKLNNSVLVVTLKVLAPYLIDFGKGCMAKDRKFYHLTAKGDEGI
jgi:tRNA A-37 threonylcarbamoyl transferase component Bud32